MLFMNRRTLSWIFALVTMFLAAYSAFVWMGTSATISGWIGLENHQGEIPHLQKKAQAWLTLAVSLPFVSAFILALGRRGDASADLQQKGERGNPEGLLSGVAAYCRRLVISVIGTLGFAALLFFVGWIMYALRPHT
jgi:hypothetical protein